MSKVKVGTVQMTCVKDKETNLQKAIEKVREAAAKGAQIVCLQELFTSLYFCDVEDYDNFDLVLLIKEVIEAMEMKAKQYHISLDFKDKYDQETMGKT